MVGEVCGEWSVGRGSGRRVRFIVLSEVSFRCRSLSKRGEDVLLLWSLDGFGDFGNKETFILNGV